MSNFYTFLLFLFFIKTQSQQLNCTVTVNSQQISVTNQQIFKTLQTSLSEFINKTDWNSKIYKPSERINCAMYLNITSYNNDQFAGTLQIQSSRQVYNSSYTSPILNFNDKDFSFKYTEFELLNFNPTVFESNLTSIISFYAYVILGMDENSFTLDGGNSNLEIAQNIATLAQQSGFKGWGQQDGLQNRYFLINDLLSPNFSILRKSFLDYHLGLDGMSENNTTSKEKIKDALVDLQQLHRSRPNAFLTRIFFDAKADEIVSIFSGGPSVKISELSGALNTLSPINSAKWASLKY